MVGSILGLPGRKLRLWGRRGEGGYISLIRSTGVALYNRGGAANPTRGNVLLVVGDVFETMLV